MTGKTLQEEEDSRGSSDGGSEVDSDIENMSPPSKAGKHSSTLIDTGVLVMPDESSEGASAFTLHVMISNTHLSSWL